MVENASIVVPTFQRAEALRITLAAIAALDPGPFEIVVVDDGSTDETRLVVCELQSQDERFRYVGQANAGVAAARNKGARASQGEVVMFIDDDIVVHPDNLARHLAVHAERPRALVAGHAVLAVDVQMELARSAFGRYRLALEEYFVADIAERYGGHGRVSPVCIGVANASLSRTLFDDIGGFDESFPFAGAEDQDFCRRVWLAGGEVVLDYDIGVIHNDQHRDFASYCRRQERSAVTTVCLAAKYPEVFDEPMLRLNGPVRAGDPLRVVVRKLSRGVLTHSSITQALLTITRLLERLRLNDQRLIGRVYRSVIALHIFRGVRRGLRMLDDPSDLRAHVS